MFLPILFACSQAQLDGLDFDAALLDREPLGGPEGGLVEETEVVHFGAAYLTDATLQATWAEDSLHWDTEFPVADWSEDRVRIVAREDNRLRLLLWLEREDLATRTYDLTTAFAGEGTLELPSARAVEVLYPEDDLTRIRVETTWLSAEVWVESTDLDQLWVPDQRWEDEEEIGEIVYLPDAAELLEEPDGDAFAWYDVIFDDPEVYAHRAEVLDYAGDHALVRLAEGDLRLTGWVDQWSDYANGGFGGCCCGGLSTRGVGSGWSSHNNVPADTPLEAPDGTVVGVTLADQYMPLGEPDAWGRLPTEVSTTWGVVEVWLRL